MIRQDVKMHRSEHDRAKCPWLLSLLSAVNLLLCYGKWFSRGASIKPGTRNIPEHPGTLRNIPEHEKIKIIFMEKKIKNKIIFVKINNNVK